MDECFGRARSPGTAAQGSRRRHRDPQVKVIPFGSEAIESAVKLYAARGDKGWSLTDCFFLRDDAPTPRRTVVGPPI